LICIDSGDPGYDKQAKLIKSRGDVSVGELPPASRKVVMGIEDAHVIDMDAHNRMAADYDDDDDDTVDDTVCNAVTSRGTRCSNDPIEGLIVCVTHKRMLDAGRDVLTVGGKRINEDGTGIDVGIREIFSG